VNFILKMAWRDTRSSRRRLLLYSMTIVLGIAGLVAVQSYAVNLKKSVADEPRRLLGGDMRVGVNAWPNADLQQYLAHAGAEVAREKVFASPLTSNGKVTRRSSVQVHAIDPAFPYYGKFGAETPDAVARLRRGERVALVDPEVAGQFHLAVGDPIKLSCGDYTVAGIVRDFPGESSLVLSLQGRVFVPWQGAIPDVPAGKPADRGNYRLYVRLPSAADPKAIADVLKSRFVTSFPVVTTAQQLEKDIDEAIVNGSHFVAMVVFVGLLLGGIGIASALSVYVQERLIRVAILRCLGASGGASMAIYLCQTAFLGVCGATGGALLGLAAQFALPALTRDLLPGDVQIFFAWQPVLSGMATGFVLCLVFALLPLLAIRRVPPLATLRSEAAETTARDPMRLAVWALIVAGSLCFAYAQTRMWSVAISFLIALSVAFGLFAGAAALLSLAARRGMPSAAPYVVRQGFSNLYRPRNRTLLLLLSLGMGLFVVLTVYLVRSTLLAHFSGDSTPNLIVYNITEPDEAGFAKLVQIHGQRVVESFPIVEMNLVTVNGHEPKSTDKNHKETPLYKFHVGATYRDSLMSSDKVAAGEFVGRVKPGTPVVPIAIARWMTQLDPKLKLGDEAVWDIDGVQIRTRIATVRIQEGLHIEPYFPVVFPEGALDAAPKKTVFFLRSPSPADTARLEQDLAQQFPKVQDYDIAVLIQTIDRVFGRIAVIIDLIASVTLGTGIVILASAIVAGRHQRARESVLLRAVGATRGQLRWVQLTEYSAIGILAGILGCGLAEAANALLAHYLFKFSPGGGAGEVALAATAVIAVTVTTGVLADRGASRLSPLDILRKET
jgi:putative ABC transport system permease protein